MDRNTIVGLVLIFVILIGFSYLTRPNEEQLKRIQEQRDSIARVEAERMALAAQQEKKDFELSQETDSLKPLSPTVFVQDSLKEEIITLENNKIRLQLSTQGGRIVNVDLKEYFTHDSLPLILWKADKSTFGLNFYAQNKQINTEEFLFVPNTTETVLNATESEKTLSLKLFSGENKYIEFIYKLAPDSYMADFSIRTHNMNDVIASNSSFLTLFWGVDMPQLEKSKDFENRYTGVYYDFLSDDVENMSTTSNEKETLSTKIKWVAFKQQFFSSILIAQDAFTDVALSSDISN